MSNEKFARPWTAEQWQSNPDMVTIYDANDLAICTVETFQPDPEITELGPPFQAVEVAAFIVERANRA